MENDYGNYRPRKVVCGFLTKLVQKVYPTAVVYSYDEDSPEEHWGIEFPFDDRESIGVGDNFKYAKYCVMMLLNAANNQSGLNQENEEER
jgi:hypothetical protein